MGKLFKLFEFQLFKGTCIKDPWIKTIGGGLNVGGVQCVGQERVMGEKWG